MNEGHIISDDGIIEAEGVLNLRYRGHSAEAGPGAGHSYSNRGKANLAFISSGY